MTMADDFDAAALTDVGLIRDHNEDAMLSRPDLGLFAVADGMGGHAAGDFASHTIVEAAQSVGRASSLDDLSARLLERLSDAHHAIVRRAQALSGTVGATFVGLMVHGDRYACAWSGDSRAYRLRDGQLHQLTVDHTEVADLVAHGLITQAEAVVHPRRNVITRAIGVGAEVFCDVAEGDVVEGDLFLLCSDGLTEHVSDDLIADHLRGPRDVHAICHALIEATLADGARDNVTCVVVRILRAQAGE